MSEMKLIMESWRAFRLTEEEAPQYKEDPQDAMALLKALASETDQQRVEKVIQQITTDTDIGPLMSALSDMFEEVTGDEEVEVDIEEGLDDLGRSVAGLGLDASAKIERFLNSSNAGRLLAKAAPAALGLALGALMIQGGEFSPGAIKTVSKLVSGAVTPETLGDAIADIGTEAIEALQERKKI